MPKAPTKITAARALYALDRAMRELLLERSFGPDQILQAADYFRDVGVVGCIYCGGNIVERWDHLVAVRSGGATVLGNLVPACQQCDDSKGSTNYRDWLLGKADLNPAKGNAAKLQEIIERVTAYQNHFGYLPPSDFSTSLTAEQLEIYSDFARTLSEFRSKLAAFGLVPAQPTEIEQHDVDCVE